MEDSALQALLATLGDHARLYALDGDDPFTQMHGERWSGSDALSSCDAWTIDALSTRDDLSLGAMLGQKLALHTTLADGDRAVRTGLVRKAQLLGADGGLARYRLSVVPWLWILSQGFHSRTFAEQSVLEIAATVFGEYAAYAAWKIRPDALQLLADVRPRSYAVQYRETDLDFVERILAGEGLGYTFVEDGEAPAGHTLVLFGDSSQLPEDSSSARDPSRAGIRFHRAAAVEASDTIQHIGQSVHSVPGQVTFLSRDYKPVRATAASVAIHGAEGSCPRLRHRSPSDHDVLPDRRQAQTSADQPLDSISRKAVQLTAFHTNRERAVSIQRRGRDQLSEDARCDVERRATFPARRARHCPHRPWLLRKRRHVRGRRPAAAA